LRERAASLVDEFVDADAPAFTTRNDAPSRDAYFLESATTIRCFFEEDARDERGRLRVPKALAINKIGHALHDLDPVFGDFTHDARFDAIARALGMTDPLVYQSMYIFKQPHIGGSSRRSRRRSSRFGSRSRPRIARTGACSWSVVDIAVHFARNSCVTARRRAWKRATRCRGPLRRTPMPSRLRRARSS
jgi:hypothetical protein